jgi:hypothetical protein
MSTVTTTSNLVKRRVQTERYFFAVMAVLIFASVFLGFAKSYFLAGMFRAHLPSLVIHIHGAVFTSWILLLIVQTLLVSARRVDIHRRLGMFGFGLACVMVVMGSLAASDLLLRNEAALSVDPKTFYAAALGDIFIFATLVLFAFRERFNPASHKRLILIATISLLGAGINRWPFEIIDREPFLTNILDDAFLLPLIAYDLWSMRKVHLATICGGLLLIVIQQLELPIGRSGLWQSFATWVLSHGKVLHH